MPNLYKQLLARTGQLKTSRWAKIYDRDFQHKETIEIKSDTDAVNYCIKTEALFFQTYTKRALKARKSILNESKNQYVGIERLYTTDELIIELEKDTSNADTIRQCEGLRAQLPQGARYFRIPSRTDGAVAQYEVSVPGEKFFDKIGKQIWPASSPSADKKPQPAP